MKKLRAVLLPMAAFLSASIASFSGVKAEPASDPSSIWTLQDENSSITTAQLNDKYYVNGLRLGWTSPTDSLPDFLSAIDNIWGPGRQRMAIDLVQAIFTPADTSTYTPDPRDRPYAGTLTAQLSLQSDTDTTRSILGFQAGLVGPDALGRQVQNGFHSIISVGDVHGWPSQIHDEPVFEILGQRIWRVPLGDVGGLQVDTLPNIEAGGGNLRVYGLAGTVFRIGQGLDSDFGVARVRPGMTGSDAYTQDEPVAWNLFIGADGEVVGHDITIDGNTFRNSANGSLQPAVGELEAGLAVMVYGMRLSYTHVLQTHEVHNQKGGLHQFGSLAISAHF